MKALLLDIPGRSASVGDIPAPHLTRPNQLLIRVRAIALNPVDAIFVARPLADPTSTVPRIVGADFSGTVIDSSIPTSDDSINPTNNDADHGHTRQRGVQIRTGDLVAGFLQGANSANPLPGAFAEHVVVDADLVWRVPDGVTPEQAAGVSLCGLTAAQMVFPRLGMPSPFPFSGDQPETSSWAGKKEVTVFVYGASTSVGMYAAQLIRKGFGRAGVRVRLVGAASKARWGMLKGETYGYEELVDYRDEGWVDAVRELAGGEGVDYALDCISEGDTVRLVHGTLKKGSKVAIVRSRQAGAWSVEGVPLEDVVYGAVWEGLGVEVQYTGFVVPASAEAREFATAFYRWLSERRNLEPSPVRVMPGGLERVVMDGFALLGSGRMEDRVKTRTEEWMRPVQAEKLVYLVS